MEFLKFSENYLCKLFSDVSHRCWLPPGVYFCSVNMDL